MNWTQPQPRQKRKPSKPATILTLNISFIDNKFNNHTKQLLNKHNILARLTDRCGLTIRELAKITPPTKPNNSCDSKTCQTPGVCQHSFVVYKATCNICD